MVETFVLGVERVVILISIEVGENFICERFVTAVRHALIIASL